MSSHRVSGSVVKANAANVVTGAKSLPADVVVPKAPAGSEDIPSQPAK